MGFVLPSWGQAPLFIVFITLVDYVSINEAVALLLHHDGSGNRIQPVDVAGSWIHTVLGCIGRTRLPG